MSKEHFRITLFSFSRGLSTVVVAFLAIFRHLKPSLKAEKVREIQRLELESFKFPIDIGTSHVPIASHTIDLRLTDAGD
jgi:hypothetical protein